MLAGTFLFKVGHKRDFRAGFGASDFVPHIHRHVSAASPCRCNTAAGPATDLHSPGSSFGCSDSWAKCVFSSMMKQMCFIKVAGSENDTDSSQF